MVATLPSQLLLCRTLGCSCGAISLKTLLLGLSVMRIPLVRWSFGFNPKGLPELVFGLGFCWVAAHLAEALFLAHGEAYLAALFRNGSRVVGLGALVPGRCLKKNKIKKCGKPSEVRVCLNVMFVVFLGYPSGNDLNVVMFVIC